MTQRVSQEAVDAAAEAAYMRSHERATKQPYQSRFWKEADNGTRAHFHELVRFPLQAALPALREQLEAEVRERLAGEFEKRADQMPLPSEGFSRGLRAAAEICRVSTTQKGNPS